MSDQSGVWRNGKEISENRVVFKGGVVSEEIMMETSIGVLAALA